MLRQQPVEVSLINFEQHYPAVHRDGLLGMLNGSRDDARRLWKRLIGLSSKTWRWEQWHQDCPDERCLTSACRRQEAEVASGPRRIDNMGSL